MSFRDARRMPLTTFVAAHTQGYTYAARVWDMSIVQGPFSVAPCQTRTFRFATFPFRWVKRGSPG
jgi:hypothetical protein